MLTVQKTTEMTILKNRTNEYLCQSKEAVERLIVQYCGQFGDLVVTALYSVLPEDAQIKATISSDSVEVSCQFSGIDRLRQEISKSWSLLSSLIKRGTILSTIKDNDASLKAKIRLLASQQVLLNRLTPAKRLAG